MNATAVVVCMNAPCFQKPAFSLKKSLRGKNKGIIIFYCCAAAVFPLSLLQYFERWTHVTCDSLYCCLELKKNGKAGKRIVNAMRF